MKKSIYLIGITVIVVLVFITGISFAYWSLDLKQTDENKIATSCFSVKFNETAESHIKLEHAFPMTDEDGSELDAYKFTVTNNCDAYAEFNLQLEVHDTSTLNNKFVKVKLGEHSPQLLTEYKSNEKTSMNNTNVSYILDTGYLDKKESKTYDLRVWLDGSVTTETLNENNESEEDGKTVQDKTWGGFVTISAAYTDKKEIILSGMKVPVVEKGDGLHKIDHEGYTGTNTGFKNSEFRYEGSDPNNYVQFNDETWRIIGLVNVKTEGGVDERIKLVGEEVDITVTDEGEITDWDNSQIKNYLNSGDYYTTNLTDDAKSMIDTDVIWTIEENSSVVTDVNEMYKNERDSEVVWKSTNDVKASVGLMYQSDYYYACTSSDSLDTCSNWIHQKGETIALEETKKVQPVLYLSSDVSIVSGTGTEEDNYILELVEE